MVINPILVRWDATISKDTLLNNPDYYYHSYRHASNYTDIFPEQVASEQVSYVEDWVWDSNSGFWKYQLGDGSFVRGWRLIDNYWYHFKPDTSLVHSCWYQINGDWYYFNTDGRMQTGWQYIDGRRYYLGEDGKLQDDSAKSDLRITGEKKPDYIQKGHFFALDGTIKSTSLNLTEVYGAILGENGRPVQEITVHPNRTTYRLNNEIDNSLIFNWLEVGTYRYVITATDTSGTKKTLIDKAFKVVQ